MSKKVQKGPGDGGPAAGFPFEAARIVAFGKHVAVGCVQVGGSLQGAGKPWETNTFTLLSCLQRD